ncbi:Flp pilus assembly protein CpaB [uncultured Tyzzerella sp.]|uniref:Flp pilus assembly protein CpaB n=1 Tax=uncultured Tyzzerella sp. TaxID=2321398 RepID=UPI002943A5DC|nr:Flp pilus assembly protein CpaB [uncultured Tyzzerella sp.]
MALKKNRTTVGIVAIVLGGVLCFGIAPIYNKSMQKGVEVVRISSEVNKGEQITADKVKVVEVSKKGLPESAILNKKDVVGKYAVVDLVRDNTILERQLSKNPIAEDKYLYGLDGTQQAISFTIQNFASGLSGKLLTGDIISIIATTMDENNNEKTSTPKELQYVKVLAVTNDVGVDKKEDNNNPEEELPTTITVLVNREQAELIANLEETSKMHVSLVYRGTEKEAQKYIEQQNSIIVKENIRN